MGRPASIWLQKAYEILADGEWHPRELVIREMMKTVPPSIAYRRGVTTSRNSDHVPEHQLIQRGARHLCHTSINGAGYIQNSHDTGEWLIRIGEQVKRPPVPLLFTVVGEDEATHVLIEIEDYHALDLEGGEFVRRTG